MGLARGSMGCSLMMQAKDGFFRAHSGWVQDIFFPMRLGISAHGLGFRGGAPRCPDI